MFPLVKAGIGEMTGPTTGPNGPTTGPNGGRNRCFAWSEPVSAGRTGPNRADDRSDVYGNAVTSGYATENRENARSKYVFTSNVYKTLKNPL